MQVAQCYIEEHEHKLPTCVRFVDAMRGFRHGHVTTAIPDKLGSFCTQIK